MEKTMNDQDRRDPSIDDARTADRLTVAGIAVVALIILVVFAASLFPTGDVRTVNNTTGTSQPGVTQTTPPTKTQ